MCFSIWNVIRKMYYHLFDKFLLYPLMSVVSTKLNIRFLNLGYLPLNWSTGSNKSTIVEDDQLIAKIIDENLADNDPSLAHCFLYEKTLSFCPKYPRLSNMKLLEVGCGLGGGIDWLKHSHSELSKIVGLDKINANKSNNFVQGDAHDLPFPSQHFDIVLNVESSHLYANMTKFLEEVSRVLKPNGYFCWADLRQKGEIECVLEECEKADLNLIHFKVVTSQIIQGLHYTSARYDKMFDKAPWFIRFIKSTLRETYCAPGTTTYAQYKNGEKQYAIGCWKKPNLT